MQAFRVSNGNRMPKPPSSGCTRTRLCLAFVVLAVLSQKARFPGSLNSQVAFTSQQLQGQEHVSVACGDRNAQVSILSVQYRSSLQSRTWDLCPNTLVKSRIREL